MGSQKTTTYFHALAFLAILLLWGISVLNGTVRALLLSVWNGQFEGTNVALKTNYTGFPLIDYPIGLLVAFFFYGTSGYDEGYQLFLFDAYSTLQSAFVWLYVETLRPNQGHGWTARPLVFGALWQCFGGAISLPLFYALHLEWVGQVKINRAVDLDKARALPFGFILGAVVPALIGMAPTWFGPDVRSAEQHQIILAAWQPDPLWVSWIFLGTAYAGTLSLGRSENTPDNRLKTYWWVWLSYILAASSSAFGHLYVMARIVFSRNDSVNLVRMYVPFPVAGQSGTGDNIFARGPWLFLQYDLIIISLSSLSWSFLLLQRNSPSRQLSPKLVGLVLFAGAFTVGPGATVSLALLFRESQLTDHIKAFS